MFWPMTRATLSSSLSRGKPRQKSSHLPSRAELTRHAGEILWPERESPRLETAVISRFAHRRHSAKGDLTGRLRQAIECASGFADVPGGQDTAAEQCPLGRPIYRIDDRFSEGHSRRRRFNVASPELSAEETESCYGIL